MACSAERQSFSSILLLLTSAFRVFKEDSDVKPGLDTNKCLIVDSECAASVVGSHTKEAKRAVPPFVNAADVAPTLTPGLWMKSTKMSLLLLLLFLHLSSCSAHEGGVKSMYRKNPLGKKTCKPSDICCFALYRIDVSLRKVPNSFILILPACISYAEGR
jgi:hypothetical protein